jgi:hypothetical protein
VSNVRIWVRTSMDLVINRIIDSQKHPCYKKVRPIEFTARIGCFSSIIIFRGKHLRPPGLRYPDSHTFYLVADSGSAISESNETNNYGTV